MPVAQKPQQVCIKYRFPWAENPQTLIITTGLALKGWSASLLTLRKDIPKARIFQLI